MIYLDHNASTPVAPEVAAAVGRALVALCGNPSSVHRAGQAARNAMDVARRQVGALIGASERDIVFTSGATEANQLALAGCLAAPAERHLLVTSAAEHPSVRNTAAGLQAHAAVEVVELGLDGLGRLDVGELTRILEAHRAGDPGCRAVVSVMLAQNELGNLYPVAELARVARRVGALVHCDATQAVGRVPVDVESLGVDLLSLSGHKLGAPKGVGALYVRRGVELSGTHVLGGHQERGRRAGTENVAGIVGLGAACALAARERLAQWSDVVALAQRLGGELVRRVDGVAWLGDREATLGNTCCLVVDEVPADVLLMALDLAGIAVSAGAACASGSLEPSHVLTAMGLARERARCAVRLSVGWTNTAEEIDAAIVTLSNEINHIRGVGEHVATAGGLR